MKWNLIGILPVAFAGLALLAGCGNSAPSESSGTKTAEAPKDGAKPKEIRIAMIAKSSTNQVFLVAKSGAEETAAKLSKERGIPISIDWRTPPNEDGQVQAQRIAQAVNEGASAVILACSDAAKVNGAINDAVAKNVPVFIFDSDAPDSKRFGFYGADDLAVGAQLVQELNKLTGGNAKIAILAGNQNAPNLQKRAQGVRDEAKKFPGMTIVDTFYHIETPNDAAGAVINAMKARPEITAWAMVGGWPLFTQTLLDAPDMAKVKIVAVDCLPAQLPYIEKGIAPVLLAQPLYDWGRVSVERIVAKLLDGKDGEPIQKMELVRVDKANLNEWAKKLHEWKLTGIDPKFLK